MRDRIGAIIRHFTNTLNGVAGVDFRLLVMPPRITAWSIGRARNSPIQEPK